jgi:hypothetical protein
MGADIKLGAGGCEQTETFRGMDVVSFREVVCGSPAERIDSDAQLWRDGKDGRRRWGYGKAEALREGV